MDAGHVLFFFYGMGFMSTISFVLFLLSLMFDHAPC